MRFVYYIASFPNLSRNFTQYTLFVFVQRVAGSVTATQSTSHTHTHTHAKK